MSDYDALMRRYVALKRENERLEVRQDEWFKAEAEFYGLPYRPGDRKSVVREIIDENALMKGLLRETLLFGAYGRESNLATRIQAALGSASVPHGD